jgi:hypothetical protein
LRGFAFVLLFFFFLVYVSYLFLCLFFIGTACIPMEVLDLPRKSHLCLLCFIATQNLVWSILVGHAPYSWGVLFTILNYISYVFFVQRCVCPRMYVVCNHAPSPSLLEAPPIPVVRRRFRVEHCGLRTHIHRSEDTYKKKALLPLSRGFLNAGYPLYTDALRKALSLAYSYKSACLPVQKCLLTSTNVRILQSPRRY